MRVRIGTRSSHLARTQALSVAGELEQLGHDTELVTIETAGDLSSATSFGAIGPQGVFVRAIEQALLDGTVDIAVHSYKDLPTQSPQDLLIAAVPARCDAADVLAVRSAAVGTGAGLPVVPGARIGTASARRQAWIRHLRPDVTVEPTRGNVPTRIGRLKEGFDGVVLAAAGLQRLRHSPLDDVPELDAPDVVIERLVPEVFVPAPAQGALAVQCRRADARLRDTLRALDDAGTRRCVDAERALLARVEGGCDIAFGAHAGAERAGTGGFRLTALLEHDRRLVKGQARGADPLALVEPVWQRLRSRLR